MNLDSVKHNCSDPAGLAAAEWVLRHDRGLTAAEQDEFSQWLAADPRHRDAWAEHRWGWDELDRLAGLQTSVHAVPDPDLLAPRKKRWFGFPLSPSLSLAAAAVAVFSVGLWHRPWSQSAVSVAAEAPPSLTLIEQRELADGSVVELNRGAVLTERFTAGERRVQLERGEAHFKVAKDASRPFVVEVAGVAVRAVGTAFNVRLDSATVEVLVTEGRVQVMAENGGRTTEDGRPRAERGAQTAVGGAEIGVADGSLPSAVGPPFSGTMLEAGSCAVVPLAPNAAAPGVTPLSAAEIEARLAWKPRMLDFTNAPLPEIIAEFNRRNPVRLTLGDVSLSTVRLSATFRSDNVEGFVRLMASDFGMRTERRGEAEICLVPAGPKPN